MVDTEIQALETFTITSDITDKATGERITLAYGANDTIHHEDRGSLELTIKDNATGAIATTTVNGSAVPLDQVNMFQHPTNPELQYFTVHEGLPQGSYKAYLWLAFNDGALERYRLHGITEFEIVADPRSPEPESVTD